MEPQGFRRVLVVEDDPGTVRIFYNLIRSLNSAIEVDSVSTAEWARTRLRHEHYDLIVADNFLLGEETGLDLWLYCSIYFPKVPVLVTSGNKLQRVISDLRAGGSSPNFLLKPFTIRQGREVLRLLLEQKPESNPPPIHETKLRTTFREILKRLM